VEVCCIKARFDIAMITSLPAAAVLVPHVTGHLYQKFYNIPFVRVAEIGNALSALQWRGPLSSEHKTNSWEGSFAQRHHYISETCRAEV